MDSHSLNPAYIVLNRSFFTLQSCIESFTEVEQLIGEVSSRLDFYKTSESKPATIRTSMTRKRTNVCSVYQDLAARKRKTKSLSFTPGPGQYFTSHVSGHSPEVKMEGRLDLPVISTPGPTYNSDKLGDMRYCYWAREPKNKHAIMDNAHLGPGTYDSKSFINKGSKGHNIDAGHSDNVSTWNTSNTTLGPGQYIMTEGYSKKGYTISKSKRLGDDKFNPHLGPGKYEPPPERFSANCKFSMSPRFDNSFQEKINSIV